MTDSRDPPSSKSPSNPGEPAPSVHGEVVRYWLDYRGHRFELRGGELMIGRSAGCQLVLDDALVSRRHARLVMRAQEVSIEDLNSANGVFVNGERINGARVLSPGDRIVVGQQEMIVRVGHALRDPLDRPRYTAVTLSGVETQAQLAQVADTPQSEESDSTHQGDALTLLGGVADKVLALGRGEEAEKILGTFLGNMLERARGGARIEASSADRAAEYAVKIAAVTNKARWVDYAVELFTIAGRPLPAGIVDQLYTILRSVGGINRNGLRLYLATLRAKQDRFGPNERFLVQRIEGLERLAALK